MQLGYLILDLGQQLLLKLQWAEVSRVDNANLWLVLLYSLDLVVGQRIFTLDDVITASPSRLSIMSYAPFEDVLFKGLDLD